jgi:hypothetical protein
MLTKLGISTTSRRCARRAHHRARHHARAELAERGLVAPAKRSGTLSQNGAGCPHPPGACRWVRKYSSTAFFSHSLTCQPPCHRARPRAARRLPGRPSRAPPWPGRAVDLGRGQRCAALERTRRSRSAQFSGIVSLAGARLGVLVVGTARVHLRRARPAGPRAARRSGLVVQAGGRFVGEQEQVLARSPKVAMRASCTRRRCSRSTAATSASRPGRSLQTRSMLGTASFGRSRRTESAGGMRKCEVARQRAARRAGFAGRRLAQRRAPLRSRWISARIRSRTPSHQHLERVEDGAVGAN